MHQKRAPVQDVIRHYQEIRLIIPRTSGYAPTDSSQIALQNEGIDVNLTFLQNCMHKPLISSQIRGQLPMPLGHKEWSLRLSSHLMPYPGYIRLPVYQCWCNSQW